MRALPVIGIMPAPSAFPNATPSWTPLLLREGDFLDRSDTYLDVVARLERGVSLEAAGKEFTILAARLAQQYPKENSDAGASVVGLRDELSQSARLLVLALCGAALCILLLACANLASLLLARAMHRARERRSQPHSARTRAVVR